ncbi:protein-(glutamine-N5) methyltransferase, release factor-specific [Desulfurobacterium indicum]|uniref:Release factor glutamine methyltransferase n=2 Tax=Desulfurobacterium indicum TaxID=1914305 RepID=A0A1R1MNM6_9BACT|nr:protein-(glutamine-N5) methyltransferase, release factor-specific [Desulfurobacterium indicum]
MKWTVMKLVRRAAEILSERGIPSPRLDAELLMCRLLGWDSRVKIYTDYDRPLSEDEVDAYRQLIKRRVKGEPVAYITGEKEFFGFKFKVNPAVLIPRPETEFLVEKSVELLKVMDREKLRIVDVGTGSGCVIISIAKLLKKNAKFFGTDISKNALAVAAENADIHGCNITFLETDLLEGIEGPFSAVVSNPPYIAYSDNRIEENVKKFEPSTALYGGERGTEIIERLAFQAFNKLEKGGFLAVECGDGQFKEVRSIFEKASFKDIEVVKDLSGKDRVVVGFKKGVKNV